jgi:PAP2 superfamily
MSLAAFAGIGDLANQTESETGPISVRRQCMFQKCFGRVYQLVSSERRIKQSMTMKAVFHFPLLMAVGSGVAMADEVTEWNRIMLDALLAPPGFAASLAQRPAAIVQAAVFDAVNGIERRYTPIHVMPAAAPGASRRAAAVQAAYASLVRLFPGQAAALDQKRTMSLLGISSGPAVEHSQSIERGLEWGQRVADAIWAWRSTDGFDNVPPPFLGGLAPGVWRPTPPLFAPGLAPQLALVTPWAIASPSQFRPAGPPSLTSDRYTADFNETKTMGSISSSSRTDDETLYARFWQSASPVDFWDPVATSLSSEHHLNLSENARLLALLNIGLADAVIGCWDAKYTYVFWRPITAIQLAGADGNPATTPDLSWTPLIPTPPFPEYPAGHACVSGAAGRILSTYFGENTHFSVASDGMPGVVRYFSSFSAALQEVRNARVFGGIHFRTACDDGQMLGIAVADYVLRHAFRPVHGEHKGQNGH